MPFLFKVSTICELLQEAALAEYGTMLDGVRRDMLYRSINVFTASGLGG